MTQEEKDLLLKDLCARLPYGVKIHIGKTQRIEVFDDINFRIGSINNTYADIKPYLFPLSSMTEEQKNDCPINETNLNIMTSNIGYGIIEMPWRLSYLFVDWCNKNHFDYRGLIYMGLANDATGLNIY